MVGYEFFESLELEENAPRVREEVIELLRAPLCPAQRTTVILAPDQLSLQIHETVGHPTELDRVLRMEASFAGTSFLSPEMEGRFRYGSEVVNVVADATCPRGLGSFGYDDEGVLAQRISIIREGIFSGFLSTRETSYRMEGEAMAQCGQSAGTTSPLSV